MMWTLFLAQALTGLQYGVLLFLLGAGLTLVLGIMNFVNLAHASLYMLGAYIGASAFVETGSFARGGRRRSGRHTCHWADRRTHNAARLLPPRSPRPGARHLRPDPVLQRAGARRLGPAIAVHARARAVLPHCRPARLHLSVLSVPGHRRRIGGWRRAVFPDPPQPGRHADPRRRQQSADGRRSSASTSAC